MIRPLLLGFVYSLSCAEQASLLHCERAARKLRMLFLPVPVGNVRIPLSDKFMADILKVGRVLHWLWLVPSLRMRPGDDSCVTRLSLACWLGIRDCVMKHGDGHLDTFPPLILSYMRINFCKGSISILYRGHRHDVAAVASSVGYEGGVHKSDHHHLNERLYEVFCLAPIFHGSLGHPENLRFYFPETGDTFFNAV